MIVMKFNPSRTLLALLLIFSIKAGSQIVNIENARMRSDTIGWQGSLGAYGSLTQNTVQIFQAGLDAKLQYKTKSNSGLWLILGNMDMLRVKSLKYVSNGMLHIRYNFKVNDWLRWEAFGQYQDNAVTQIDHRILLGTGPRFKLVDRKSFRMYLASLMMFENEKEITKPAVIHNDIRNSSYLSFTWLPASNLELVSTSYLQPKMDQFSDNRILNQVSFKVKATPHFSMSIKWNYLHDKFPAGKAPKTVYTFGTGLNYEL